MSHSGFTRWHNPSLLFARGNRQTETHGQWPRDEQDITQMQVDTNVWRDKITEATNLFSLLCSVLNPSVSLLSIWLSDIMFDEILRIVLQIRVYGLNSWIFFHPCLFLKFRNYQRSWWWSWQLCKSTGELPFLSFLGFSLVKVTAHVSSLPG